MGQGVVVKARAQRKNRQQDAKPWHEGDTRDEVIQAVISKELWNVAIATGMTHSLMQTIQPEKYGEVTWQELHDRNVRHWGGADGDLTVPFTLEWDNGETEEIEINLSSTAVMGAGLHLELNL
jgi:hypothetical protein